MFKIIHISDLHFNGGASQNNQQYSHSIPHMRGVEKIIKSHEHNTDLVIVTGDISDFGDEDNLLLGRQWIYSSLEIGNKEKTSIGINESNREKLRLIPGNHDAWNSKTISGKTLDRRQKSLENFNYVFPEHQFDSINGCNYDWLEKDNHSLFLLFLDSSYLGDPELEHKEPNMLILDKVAKGKMSRAQAEYVLEIFDKGMKGKLEYKHELIPKIKFNKSLKIIVMHHYLFEPDGTKSEHFLQFEDRDNVFTNLALADFDVLLCGHKHMSNLKDLQYIRYLNKRAKYRYLLNYFRRLIGIHSLPVQLIEKNGKKIPKLITYFWEFLLRKNIQLNNDNDITDSSVNFLNELGKIFSKGLDNPFEFESLLKAFINKHNLNALSDDITDENEIQEIIKRVKIEFSKDEREQLKIISDGMKKIIKKLSSRQFLQVMAGSACKASVDIKKNRSFNIYHIEPTEFGYRFQSDKYYWDYENKVFLEEPIRKTHEFNFENRPRYQ